MHGAPFGVEGAVAIRRSADVRPAFRSCSSTCWESGKGCHSGSTVSNRDIGAKEASRLLSCSSILRFQEEALTLNSNLAPAIYCPCASGSSWASLGCSHLPRADTKSPTRLTWVPSHSHQAISKHTLGRHRKATNHIFWMLQQPVSECLPWLPWVPLVLLVELSHSRGVRPPWPL